jgi:adenine phosphoribosyltransferase
MSAIDLRSFIRDVPDFPKPGIVFKDITPLLRSPQALDETIEQLVAPYRNAGITSIVAIESRGFIFGSCVAQQLHAGFIPVRKPGKLPWTTRRHEYVLEYGSDVLEIHDDAIGKDDRILIVDDVLATGGTMHAAVQLVRGFGAEIVGVLTVIELSFLEGRQKLGELPVHSVLRY